MDKVFIEKIRQLRLIYLISTVGAVSMEEFPKKNRHEKLNCFYFNWNKWAVFVYAIETVSMIFETGRCVFFFCTNDTAAHRISFAPKQPMFAFGFLAARLRNKVW